VYKQILVPHAGTPAGDEALRHAIHIAKSSSSKIILLHIVEEVPRPSTFGLSESERENLIENLKEVNESLKEEARKAMEKKSEDIKEGFEILVRVESGDAAEIILDTIKQENVDLVIMAKRRKLQGVKKLLSLGSVSRKVVENVTCPVMLLDIEKI